MIDFVHEADAGRLEGISFGQEEEEEEQVLLHQQKDEMGQRAPYTQLHPPTLPYTHLHPPTPTYTPLHQPFGQIDADFPDAPFVRRRRRTVELHHKLVQTTCVEEGRVDEVEEEEEEYKMKEEGHEVEEEEEEYKMEEEGHEVEEEGEEEREGHKVE